MFMLVLGLAGTDRWKEQLLATCVFLLQCHGMTGAVADCKLLCDCMWCGLATLILHQCLLFMEVVDHCCGNVLWTEFLEFIESTSASAWLHDIDGMMVEQDHNGHSEIRLYQQFVNDLDVVKNSHCDGIVLGEIQCVPESIFLSDNFLLGGEYHYGSWGRTYRRRMMKQHSI